MKDVHNGAVALLVVCPTTREVASVGIDRRIAVFREKAIGLGLVFAGGIDEVIIIPANIVVVMAVVWLI